MLKIDDDGTSSSASAEPPVDIMSTIRLLSIETRTGSRYYSMEAIGSQDTAEVCML